MKGKPLLPIKKESMEDIIKRLEAGEKLDDIVKVEKEEKKEEKAEVSHEKDIKDLIIDMTKQSNKYYGKSYIYLGAMSILAGGFFGTIGYEMIRDDKLNNNNAGYFELVLGGYAIFLGINSIKKGYKMLKKTK